MEHRHKDRQTREKGERWNIDIKTDRQERRGRKGTQSDKREGMGTNRHSSLAFNQETTSTSLAVSDKILIRSDHHE